MFEKISQSKTSIISVMGIHQRCHLAGKHPVYRYTGFGLKDADLVINFSVSRGIIATVILVA